jgi:aliphatic nitrilase
LICGENTNPLARYALMAQGEQVHVSSYPPIWPTRPVDQAGGYNLRRAIEIRAGAHAFEAKVFNIVAAGCVDASMRDALAGLRPEDLETLDATPRGVSLVIDPTGEVISEVLEETEGIVYAEVDIGRCVEPKQFHDVVGYYNRFDIFRLSVDRSPREPAVFLGEFRPATEASGTTDGEPAGERPQDADATHRGTRMSERRAAR